MPLFGPVLKEFKEYVNRLNESIKTGTCMEVYLRYMRVNKQHSLNIKRWNKVAILNATKWFK